MAKSPPLFGGGGKPGGEPEREPQEAGRAPEPGGKPPEPGGRPPPAPPPAQPPKPPPGGGGGGGGGGGSGGGGDLATVARAVGELADVVNDLAGAVPPSPTAHQQQLARERQRKVQEVRDSLGPLISPE